jgi:hypothetical protein
MTKKHYIKIAKILNTAYNYTQCDEGKSLVCNIAQAMAEEFQTDNKNFNYTKWIQAVHKEN